MDKILPVLTGIFLILFVMGMIWPWYFLWFVDQKTRLKILIYYGLPLLLLTCLTIIF